MGEHLLTVVKFGSSVLRTENEIGLLVEEIRRWSSEKSRVSHRGLCHRKDDG
jgi:hypothetical protein